VRQNPSTLMDLLCVPVPGQLYGRLRDPTGLMGYVATAVDFLLPIDSVIIF
jgi:hypothetical protein